METPQKTVIQNGTPVSSKLKPKNSPVFNYIDSLSPIKPVRSNPIITQTFGSLSPCVFTPGSHKGSRFKSPTGPSKEALLETVPPQILLKNDDFIATPPRRASETDLQKMYDDNVKRKSETPDWETLFPDTPDLIYDTLNDSEEADRCFLPALEPFPNSKKESPDEANHRGVRRRLLDFEIPSMQTSEKSSSSSCVVPPTTGLQHLNAFAMSSKDSNVGNGNRVSQSLALMELNQSSPQKKKLKSEQAGEGESSSCKRCHCKKSKCLKLYCECFAAGVYCIESCSCVECFNKPIHADTVLATRNQIKSRNPLAFAPKVIRNSDSIDASKTPASGRHKRGCNCKKSNCLKKYCECYQSGVGCSINCRCEECKNAFGRRYESSFVGMDESNTVKTQQNTELLSSVLSLPSTPMPLRQPLAELPISSNNNMLLPQPSQQLRGASGSSLYESQSFRKQGMSLLSHSRTETITDDIENVIPSSITNIINAVSPNKPHLDSSELTPRRRNGERKLLLSIPTFPSLTPHH